MHGSDAQTTEALRFIDDYLSSGRSRDEILILMTLLRSGDAKRAFELVLEGPIQHETMFFRELWKPANQAVRRDPAFHAFAKEIGFLASWKAQGWPDLCKPTPERGEDAFSCD